MKNTPWLVRLRHTSIPEHKLRPAKWLALIALLLLLAQLMIESLLLTE
ncbi:TPA: hypothetical protein RQO31_002489 [Klebsiella oxytoca]|nr:hypothetical protein [Klebsiella oxytoca]